VYLELLLLMLLLLLLLNKWGTLYLDLLANILLGYLEGFEVCIPMSKFASEW